MELTMEKIQKIEQNIIHLPASDTFSVIGDPGCEGLGTDSMRVYANALKLASEDDFILIAGDLVPVGADSHYRKVWSLTGAASEKPIYVLRGNHDTGAYENWCGLSDYALIGDKLTVIILDNAKRKFSETGLALLKDVLTRDDVQTAVIAFHIPIPNHFTGNSVSDDEFEKLKACYEPWKDKVAYFICGHVHSCFEDVVDRIPLICTGGGGAMIEDVSKDIRACDVEHHIVRFSFQGGKLTHRFLYLDETPYRQEISDPIMKEKLTDAVQGELMAHLKYLCYAEKAEKRGYSDTANLFRALAESEYRHARNFFSVLNTPESFRDSAAAFIPGEHFEYDKLYKMLSEYAKEQNFPLSGMAFKDAAAAEKVHADLLSRCAQGQPIPDTIYVCTACGYVMDAADGLERCPICGAPLKQFSVHKNEEESGVK